MSSKRFRTRRFWFNTIIWSMITAMVMLASVVIVMMTGNLLMIVLGGIVVIVGFIISWIRDRGEVITYLVENDQLVLKRAGQEERVAIKDVQDASLLDRVAARDYIQQRMRLAKEQGSTKEKLEEMGSDFMRYCSVDIGLRSYSFGIGRDMTDRMQMARHDLVIVRLHDGRVLLLAPVYTQDLVESIGRILQRLPRSEKRA